MITQEYVVTGMTCQHCVDAVTDEVTSVPGVADVRVQLATGRLVVISGADIPFAGIEAAVDEAGYTVERAERAS